MENRLSVLINNFYIDDDFTVIPRRKLTQNEGEIPARRFSDVPPSQQEAEAEPKKYTGGSIPSRSFRMLQAMTGEDSDDSPGIAYKYTIN